MATKKRSKKITKKTAGKPKKQPKKTVKTRQKKTVRKKPAKPAAGKRKPVASRLRQLKAKKVVSKPVKAKTKKPAKAKESPEAKKEALRKSLLQIREHLVKEAKVEISKYIKGENRQLVDTALDDGDWSIVDLSEDVSFKQLGTHREILLKVNVALRKLEEGTYGICEDCGEEICVERLKVMPFAIYCRDCQEKIEELEAIKKEVPI